MIYQSPQNPNVHLTVKDRTWPSYPTKQLWNRKLIQGRVLDFGCGLGTDVKFLQENGVDVVGYDPHYAPEYPTGRFDTILCHYVLNVLLPEEQAHVLMAVSELLQPKGRAYFTVRRDIKRSGFRTHTKQNCKVYQCKVMLPYQSVISAEHCEVYEYQHLNIRCSPQNDGCPYCNPSADYELITESATAYTLLVKQEKTQVHALIVPKRHVNDYFELSQHEKTACWIMVDRVRTLLENLVHPQGYNISVNSVANQDYTHIHICLVPNMGSANE
jgi:diadenosine tetraphosphate (Ap4A) HIT family hydrolase